MDNLLDPLTVGQRIGQQLSERPLSEDDGTTVDCKTSINVLPLRYSAVYAEEGDQAALNRVPEFTGPPVADTPLSQAKYASRFLREGYLYVLVNRLGTYGWEHCFHVSADALLSPMDPSAPTKASGGMPFFTINEVEDVSEGFMLFLPDPLSLRLLEQIRTQSSQRNKLQRFAFATLAHSCGGEDVIEPTVLGQKVAEFVGFEDKEVGQLLQKQMFPALTDPQDENAQPADLADQWSRFDSIQRALEGEKGFAVVLSDAIGITQELNNHRNDALEPLKDWMEREDDQGISNEQRFYTAELIRNLRNDYTDGRISSLAQQDVARYRLRVGMRYMPSVRAVGEAAIGGNSQPLARDYELAEEYQQGQVEVFEESKQRISTQRKAEFEQEYDQKYKPLLDQDAREAFEARMADKSLEQEALLASRADAHLAWLQSESFLDSLEWYDSRSIIWGWSYAIQVMQATIGMDGTEKGAALLAEWWKDINLRDRANLAWGVYCLNQMEIRSAGTEDIQEFRANDAAHTNAADDTGWIGPDPARIMDGFKQLTTAFGTANSALAVDTPEWFRTSSLGITMGWYTQFMRGFFENARIETMDRATLRITLGLMKAQLARQASQIGIKRLWLSRGLPHEEAKVRRFLTRDISATLDANSTQFLRFRLGVVVAIIETYSLYDALSRHNKGTRDYAKIAGSAVTLVAAIADTVATGINMLLVMGKYRATDVGAAATFQLGGFSFWGGMLASVGAMFSAADDFAEAVAHRKNNILLASAYFSRFSANVGIAVLGTAVGLASSASYLAKLAEYGKSQLMRKLASLLLPLARTLATATVRGVLVSSALIIGYAVTSWTAVILSVGLWFFSDDGLQEWCKRCVFSKEDNPDYYDDYADETGAFYQALQDVN